jgi:hypothetical protein
MAFEKLLNIVAAESQLLEMLVAEIQANYFKYQNECYFLKLEKVFEIKSAFDEPILDGGTSKITWIKSFTDIYIARDFFYDTKFQRACILLKFERRRYELLCQGFFFGNSFEIWPDKIVDSRPYGASSNLEETLQPSHEFLAQAFGDITSKVSSLKRVKTV